MRLGGCSDVAVFHVKGIAVAIAIPATTDTSRTRPELDAVFDPLFEAGVEHGVPIFVECSEEGPDQGGALTLDPGHTRHWILRI